MIWRCRCRLKTGIRHEVSEFVFLAKWNFEYYIIPITKRRIRYYRYVFGPRVKLRSNDRIWNIRFSWSYFTIFEVNMLKQEYIQKLKTLDGTKPWFNLRDTGLYHVTWLGKTLIHVRGKDIL